MNLPCTIWLTNEGLFRKLESTIPDGQLNLIVVWACQKSKLLHQDGQPQPIHYITNLSYAGLEETELYSEIKSDHWIFNTGDSNPCRAPS
jgi:hypothetical protein